ncbi:MAG: hypothetical protein LBP22_07880 [Deltaproteobacteria bacterium]|nr:hypothetical protein [Deltaproteobacteria bacterium]
MTVKALISGEYRRNSDRSWLQNPAAAQHCRGSRKKGRKRSRGRAHQWLIISIPERPIPGIPSAAFSNFTLSFDWRPMILINAKGRHGRRELNRVRGGQNYFRTSLIPRTTPG